MSENEEEQLADGEEPSMEDILASIRRILAEDEEAETETQTQTQTSEELDNAGAITMADDKPEAEPEAAPEMDVDSLLAEMDAGTPEPVMDVDLTPEPEPEPEPELEPDIAFEEETVPESEPVLESPPPPPPPPTEDIFELTQDMVSMPTGLSEATVRQSSDMLGELARAILDRRDLRVRDLGSSANVTLESLVREMLKPILNEWLDRNLSYMIERLVKIEIDNMVNRAQRLDLHNPE